mgnify:CR=1 FL=1
MNSQSSNIKELPPFAPKEYKTAQVAKIIGIHPNTVRMYEDLGLISKPTRKNNGYRVFSDLHIDQFKLARKAFQIEVLQNGLRKKTYSIVKCSALCDFEKALTLTGEYITAVETEIRNANEAVLMVQELLSGAVLPDSQSLKRKEVSELLDINMDTLRNWEMNGLLRIKRKENGYRIYTDEDIRKLKVIRSLRCANYSLTAILRMMRALELNAAANVGQVLNTPGEEEEIISVYDNLVISLNSAGRNAREIQSMLIEMKNKY